MGEVAKWGILVAAAVLLIGIICAFPIMSAMNVSIYSAGIATVITYAGDALIFGRGLINNLLSPWARSALSGLMLWLVGKWIVTYSLKIMTWVYHYIFK